MATTQKERIIQELVYSASGRFSACETTEDFRDQTRLYTALLTERIADILGMQSERIIGALEQCAADGGDRETIESAIFAIRQELKAMG